jgi:hypothetical protein
MMKLQAPGFEIFKNRECGAIIQVAVRMPDLTA